MEYTQELLNFATSFSENYKSLPEGFLESENKSYRINYYNNLIDEGSGLFVCARVDAEDGLMEIDRNFFSKEEITKDFAFYIIIWLYTIYTKKCDFVESDLISFEYYLSTGRKAKDIFVGWSGIFDINITQDNSKRYEALTDFIDKYKN